MASTLAFLFAAAEAAQAAVNPLVSARLVAPDFELDTDLARYGVAAAAGADRCVLRVHLDPGQSEELVSQLLRESGGRPVALPVEEQQRLSLEVERLRMERVWRSMLGQHVPMAVAAATTFHQVHRTTKAIVTRRDYDDALNIAASALSSLVPIYTVDARQRRVEVAINLVKQRFALGATQLRSADGHIVDNLSVQRADLLFALTIVKRAGRPFSFALLAPERAVSPADSPAPKKTETDEKP